MYGLIESLSELLRIPSVSGNEKECKKALDFLLEVGNEFGFRIGRSAGGKVGYIEIGEGDETLGVLTHVDVAHPGDISQWETDPFSPVMGGGKIYGRGIVDDKGPAVAALFAMRDVVNASKKHHISMNKKIRLIIGTQQKMGGGDIREYLLENPAPSYSFTPDGKFGVCNMELGTLDLLLSFPIDEESMQIADIKAGTGTETIPDLCKIKLKDGRIFATRGKAGHASEPLEAENAVFEMTAALSKLKRRARAEMQEDTVYRVLHRLEYAFSDGRGLPVGISSMPNEYRDVWGENRVAPTGVFCKNNRLYVNVNCHYTADSTDVYIIKSIRKFFKNEAVRVERISSRQPSVASKGLPFIKELQEAYANVIRKPCELGVNTVSTYAQIVPNTVVFGPSKTGEPDMRHRAGEYMKLRDLMLTEMIFSRAMGNVTFKNQSFRLGG